MKTQISRHSHRPERRYSGVYQQQGRMITDADWNELMELVKRRLDDVLTDVVASGAPRMRGLELSKAGAGQPLRIKRGLVYADGVVARVVGTDPEAETFDYDEQADFPNPPLPQNNYRVYADVWERTVVSLEDADLRDPALHGADTTTRTQTMAQVKWCAGSVDPEDPSANPKQGDAQLTIKLRKKKEAKDPCDPCADEVGVAARTGNYLFRLEVHDVKGSFSDPEELTLKWSSENGAEQHAVPESTTVLPPAFTAGDWVYEFYSEASEKHLGIHMATGFTPTRGQLETSVPPSLPAPSRVRRWDGYCTLNQSGNTWSLKEGRDRGLDLSTISDANADGHVDLGDDFKVKLEALTLTLTLENGTFVAGDHWLAAVREAVHSTGDTLLDDEPPLGITHHYVRLGNVDGAGNLEAYPTAEARRLNFPPLTDLDAGDVGYGPDCLSDLFDPNVHDTVEKALDRVCQIAAQHVAFDKPCNTSIYKGVPEADLKTVADALKLLCDIKATHVLYEPNPACTDLVGAATVQEALDTLCLRPSGGGACQVTVSTGENLEEVIRNLLSQGRTDLCLCLLPGNHKLTPTGPLDRHGVHLAITGCGPATRLALEGGALAFTDLGSLALGNLAIDRGTSAGVEVRGCRQVKLTWLQLVGMAIEAPLLRIADAERIHLSGNLFEARREDVFQLPRGILGDFGVFTDFDRTRFFREADVVGRRLATRPAAERQSLARQVSQNVQRLGGSGRLSRTEMRAYSEFSRALMIERVHPPYLSQVFRAIRVATLAAPRPFAVFIEDATADTTIEDCEVVGLLQFYGTRPGQDLSDPELENLEGLIRDRQLFLQTSGSALQVRGNRLSSLTLGAEMLDHLREALDRRGEALGGIFGTTQLSDNTLVMAGNQLVSGFLNLTSNVFNLDDERLGWAAADSAVYTGNQAADRKVRLINISREREESANTLQITS